MQANHQSFPLQLRQHDFERKVLSILDQTDVDPSLIELEITETLLLERADEVIALIERLRGKQISFSIDDFGTGYSSLQYLKRLPVQRLKIAREFIRNTPHAPSDAAMVTAVIELARQFAFLKQKGCNEIQGYYFSHSLSATELLPLLQRGNILRKGIEFSDSPHQLKSVN